MRFLTLLAILALDTVSAILLATFLVKAFPYMPVSCIVIVAVLWLYVAFAAGHDYYAEKNYEATVLRDLAKNMEAR